MVLGRGVRFLGRVRDGAQYAARNRSLAEATSHIQPGLRDLSRIRSELQGVGRLDLRGIASAEAAAVASSATAGPSISARAAFLSAAQGGGSANISAPQSSPMPGLTAQAPGEAQSAATAASERVVAGNPGAKGRSTFSDPFLDRDDVSHFSLRTDEVPSGADVFISSLEDAAVARALTPQRQR